MSEPRSTGGDLGGVLAVVRPHPVSVLIGCIPGIVLVFTLFRSAGLSGILSLFDSYAQFAGASREFLIGMLIVSVLVLGLGLRHILDRAELCQEGMRFLGKAYRYNEMGPISWSHQAQNGLTRYFDTTTMRFQYQGKTVKLRTRYLQDLSYQYHRAYATDPVARPGPAYMRPDSTNSEQRYRPPR